MMVQKYFQKSAWLFLSIVFIFFACTSIPDIHVPASESSSIKEYKTIRIQGYHKKRDTGIFLAKGDTYTIMATGRIRKWRSGGLISPGSYSFIMRIGHQYYGAVFPTAMDGGTFISPFSGKLYLGIADRKYDDNSGYFDVVIILWRDKNYIKIADFLEEMKKTNPTNTGVLDASVEAGRMKKIAKMEKKTNHEMAATEKALRKLKEEPATLSGSSANVNKKKQVKTLESKLAKLNVTLTELDKMKQELGIARQQTAQLSQRLKEKEKREKELLNKIASGIKNPPILLITSPANGLKTESKTVRLSGAAEDEQGLKQLNIFVNSKLIDDSGNRGIQVVKGIYSRRLDIDRRIPLKKGRNQIKIHVIDTDGLFTEKTLIVHHIERRRNVWAVVIGINDYPRIRKLKYAVNDAKAFYDLLVQTNQIPPENVFLMLNEQANLKQVRSTLGTRLKNKASKDDMVIIYFAGHGATERDMMSPDGDGLEKYLLPYDAVPNDLYSSALPMREIAHILHRISSERLVFIADACYSGASGGRTVSTTGIRANLSDAFIERIAGGKGKIIITASSANEVSVEKDELRHGVFTYYMVEGLRGRADSDRDGLITVDEAYRYVSDKVTRATGQEQHPVKKGAVEGRLVLGVVQ